MQLASKGFAYSLSLIQWDLFATLTFKNPVPPELKCWAQAWRHVERVGKILGTSHEKALIALRSEHGELHGRFHFHYLYGGGRSSNLQSAAFTVAYDWKCATGGHAEVRPYNPHLAGAEYIEGCLNGGNAYELNKFNRSDRLELSRRVVQRLRCMRGLFKGHTGPARVGVTGGGC